MRLDRTLAELAGMALVACTMAVAARGQMVPFELHVNAETGNDTQAGTLA